LRPGAAVERVALGQDVELADHRQAHRLLDGFVLVRAERVAAGRPGGTGAVTASSPR